MSEATKGAVRAAVNLSKGGTLGMGVKTISGDGLGMNYTLEEVATIIDQETGLPELLEVLEEARVYCDDRADIQSENPGAPNDWMRLQMHIEAALAKAEGD